MPGEDAQTLVAGLVASHGMQLRRFLLARVRNVADVPGFIQEVYLRMLRIPNAESIRSPEAYLFTVAHHVVQQHGLRSSAAPRHVELSRMFEPVQAAPDANPELDASAQQCLDQLQSTLDQLHPKARAAFILSRRDGALWAYDYEDVRIRIQGTSSIYTRQDKTNPARCPLGRQQPSPPRSV